MRPILDEIRRGVGQVLVGFAIDLWPLRTTGDTTTVQGLAKALQDGAAIDAKRA